MSIGLTHDEIVELTRIIEAHVKGSDWVLIVQADTHIATIANIEEESANELIADALELRLNEEAEEVIEIDRKDN